jgi:hypothetical protein
VSERRLDPSCYDLLASEARLASFVAIAQGEVPQESWFALGRLPHGAGGRPVLLSWSGSMFEYLMPMLGDADLRGHAPRPDVPRDGRSPDRVRKAARRSLGHLGIRVHSVDASLSYQYRAFGVPGLGLKRGLADDLVVTPYASALALMVAPEAACANLQRLASEGSPRASASTRRSTTRLARAARAVERRGALVHGASPGHDPALARASPARAADAEALRVRPALQATLLLLQERVPKAAALHAHRAELSSVHAAAGGAEAPVRIFDRADTPLPEVQLLSNGRYHVMVTNGGGGSSRWKDLAVTRWREDGTCDNRGMFCYVRDVGSGRTWSAAHQPTLARADRYEAIFTEARAEFQRTDGDLRIAHGDRRVARGRHGAAPAARHQQRAHAPHDRGDHLCRGRARAPAADALHPAFSNLFVQTEIVAARGAILCTRRPRSLGEPAPWMFHLVAVHGAECLETSFETSRADFIGRGRTVANPKALAAPGPLGGAEGSVSIPSSPFATASRSSRTRPRRSTSPRASPRRARPRSRSSASTRTGISPTACSTSRGPTAVSRCGRSTRRNRTRNFTRASPDRSSTRGRRCVRRPRCW